jgi:hypothetical protein
MAVMEKLMVMRVKTSVQNFLLWAKWNFSFLFTLVFAIALGIVFVMHPHMLSNWMSDGCGACKTGPIAFEQ